MIKHIYQSVTYLVLIFTMAGCGGGSTQETGTLQLGITDAPVDSAEAVVIHFDRIILHHENGNIEETVYDPQTMQEGYSIDLLALQSGQWTGVLDKDLPAGHYSWIRLEIDLRKSYIQINGQQFGLRCTSCENNGYKLNSSFIIESEATLAYMLDFDLRKSITDPNNSGTNYILRPTLRTIETAASGKLSGTVDATLIANLGGIEGCSVYVFNGHDALLDDVYIPFTSAMPASQNNPVSSATVRDDGSGTYLAAFLPEGDYTAALTCDAENDSAARDDALVFGASANVSIIAGETTTQDLTMPIASP
ncbi:MAG: DUF4382 domain-containing protein [Thioalkalispiraceae bacterium]|jgi:hypothetical protein